MALTSSLVVPSSEIKSEQRIGWLVRLGIAVVYDLVVRPAGYVTLSHPIAITTVDFRLSIQYLGAHSLKNAPTKILRVEYPWGGH
jgi:hypothetical protein